MTKVLDYRRKIIAKRDNRTPAWLNERRHIVRRVDVSALLAVGPDPVQAPKVA